MFNFKCLMVLFSEYITVEQPPIRLHTIRKQFFPAKQVQQFNILHSTFNIIY